jgi:hypothetical protein
MTTGAEGRLMADGVERSGTFWSLVAWGAAVVAGIVVGTLVGWFAGAPAGLIFGVVAFVLVGFLVDFNFGPTSPDEAHLEPANQLHHRRAEAAPVAPAAAAPGMAGLEPAHAEATLGGGISERVREAARAAGEAARAALGDGGVRGGGGVPSPLMGEGVPPRPDPEPVPPGPVPPEPVPVPPEPLPPGPIAGDVGTRPAGLDAPREGRADDLKRIRGVGPKLEDLLHRLGFWHYDQVATWTDEEVAWVDSHLEGFNGRATRDDWVGQARVLAGGGETEFSRRIDKGEVY